MVRGKQDAWDAQICLLWGDRFLTWVKSNVTVESDNVAPGAVWRVKFTPRVGVELTLLREEERREVQAGEDRVGFLPRWYFKEIQEASSEHGVEPEPNCSLGTASSVTTIPTGWQI